MRAHIFFTPVIEPPPELRSIVFSELLKESPLVVKFRAVRPLRCNNFLVVAHGVLLNIGINLIRLVAAAHLVRVALQGEMRDRLHNAHLIGHVEILGMQSQAGSVLSMSRETEVPILVAVGLIRIKHPDGVGLICKGATDDPGLDWIDYRRLQISDLHADGSAHVKVAAVFERREYVIGCAPNWINEIERGQVRCWEYYVLGRVRNLVADSRGSRGELNVIHEQARVVNPYITY